MVCGGCGAVVGMVCGALGLWWVSASGSRKLVSDVGVAPPPKSITKLKNFGFGLSILIHYLAL